MARTDDSIASTRSTIGTNQGLPSESAFNKINSLKLKVYKLKEVSLALAGMDQAEWKGEKEQFQKVFLSAKEMMATRVTIV